MDFILSGESKIAIKSKCRKLQMLAGLLQSSRDETLRLLGNELEDIEMVIDEENSSALPEHAE